METCFNQPWANVDILPACLEMSTAVDPNPCLLLGMFSFAFSRCFIALCYFNKIHFHSEYTFFSIFLVQFLFSRVSHFFSVSFSRQLSLLFNIYILHNLLFFSPGAMLFRSH